MAKGIYERKGKNGDVTYYIRYHAHLVPEHKVQAVAKLEDRFKATEDEAQGQSAIVSTELKAAIGAELSANLAQNRNFFGAKGTRNRNL